MLNNKLTCLARFRKKIWAFVEKHMYVIFFFIITALSIFLRYELLRYESGDYTVFLKQWFEQLKDNGGFRALNMPVGDYNAPYLTIMAGLTYIPINPLYTIKAVSIFFDYVCAFAIMSIAGYLIGENKNKKIIKLFVYSVGVFLPTVFLNSSCWAQADSIYTAFVLLSLLFMIKKKYTFAFVLYGVSFAFKLQAVFILPLYVLMYLSEHKFSVFNFLLIPIVNIVMCIPAMAFGKTLQDCMSVYINQTGIYNMYICLNFPNVYSLFFNNGDANLIATPNDYVTNAGIIFTIIVFAIIAMLVFYKKIKFDSSSIIEFGLWTIMISTFLLPRMHDRYLFMGDVLSILYFIGNRKRAFVPIIIEFISLYTYFYCLFYGCAIRLVYIGIIYTVLIVIYSYIMIKKYFLCDDEDKKIYTK